MRDKTILELSKADILDWRDTCLSYSIGWSYSVLSDSKAHCVTVVDMKMCLSDPSILTLSIIMKMLLILTVIMSLAKSVGKYKTDV